MLGQNHAWKILFHKAPHFSQFFTKILFKYLFLISPINLFQLTWGAWTHFAHFLIKDTLKLVQLLCVDKVHAHWHQNKTLKWNRSHPQKNVWSLSAPILATPTSSMGTLNVCTSFKGKDPTILNWVSHRYVPWINFYFRDQPLFFMHFNFEKINIIKI